MPHLHFHQSDHDLSTLYGRVLNKIYFLLERFNSPKIRTISSGSYLDTYLSKVTNMGWRPHVNTAW